MTLNNLKIVLRKFCKIFVIAMANLDIALQKVLGWEGGFSNDPRDSGGATFRGITIVAYTKYCKLKGKPMPSVLDLKRLDYSTIRDLADVLYWKKIKGEQIKNQSIANLCFDCVWGSGTGYIKNIQGVLGVLQDGIFGSMTLNAMNTWQPQRDLFQRLWNRRKIYLEGCKGSVYYLKGWMRRLNSYTFEN